MQHDMEAIILWHCSGVMEAQADLIVAFRSSALLDARPNNDAVIYEGGGLIDLM